VLYRDRRLGGVEHLSIGKPKGYGMRIHERILNAVCFMCARSHAGGKRQWKLVGTGFFVGLPGYGSEPIYLVTARHCIDEAREWYGSNLWARFNMERGEPKYIEIQPDEWTRHPDTSGVDAAVAPFTFPANAEATVLDEEMLAYDDVIADWRIGIGDSVVTVGLFTKRAGNGQNIPIVRCGNIAAMPGEMLEDRKHRPYRAYLVEARSIGGLSGSPVFVDLGYDRDAEGRINMRSHDYLLGLVRGHWDYESEFLLDAEPPKKAKRPSVNSGIAIVTPIQDLHALFDAEQVMRNRKAIERAERARAAPTDDAARDDAAEGTSVRRGPEPERVKIDGAFDDAARKLIRTPRPEGGYPKPAGRKRKPKS
jgi:hypothetical protein